MQKFKTEIEKEISRVVADFLNEQLGEYATSVTTLVSGNMFSVRADNCLAPSEIQLGQNEKHWHLLQEVKARQFDKVKPLLKEQLEELTGCKILNIYSIVGQDGVRFEFFTLSQNLENKLLKKEEAAS
ncbi:MAG: Na-translocating system protein MpsC family protein [bacterium]